MLNIVFASGSAAGAPLGGFFADSIGWRWFVAFPTDSLANLIYLKGILLTIPFGHPRNSLRLARPSPSGK